MVPYWGGGAATPQAGLGGKIKNSDNGNQFPHNKAPFVSNLIGIGQLLTQFDNYKRSKIGGKVFRTRKNP